MLKARFSIFAVLMIMMLAFGGAAFGQTTPEKLTATELFKAFADDEKAAMSKYAGKEVMITGKIVEVDISKSVVPVPCLILDLGADFDLESISCAFPDQAIDKLKTLSEDQQVTVIGTVNELRFGMVLIIENCRLAE